MYALSARVWLFRVAECVGWARRKFDSYFRNRIEQLLHNFPPTATTSQRLRFGCLLLSYHRFRSHASMHLTLSKTRIPCFFGPPAVQSTWLGS
eukprot:4685455-Pleurochrysis_carterae.AAC.2